ncbi:sterol 3-beta-glucosyltransferase UGT80B1-like [Hibiscus syriacus]|uniref:sterol 3-beta-glucosyltransferase UGT80B1-like n=1 Tax=Hibiscus syriacus TaxID=106335 RepID=UPI001922DE03|nr:sterol 3-beta-glucosyltransferase UGT80B1-like [Hibiscus syriacus]
MFSCVSNDHSAVLGDQFFWGDRIHQRGLGRAPIPISELSVEKFSNAIRFMLQPEVKSHAMELAKLIENEDGVAAAVDAFHRHLPPELPLPTAALEGMIIQTLYSGSFYKLENCAACLVDCGNLKFS